MFRFEVAIFCMVFLSSCTHIERMEGYEPTSYSLGDVLDFRILMDLSKDDSKDGATIYGEPYELVIVVSSKSGVDSVRVRNVVFDSLDPDYSKMLLQRDFREVEGLRKEARIIRLDVGELRYENFTLTFDVAARNGADGLNKSVEVKLVKDFSEERVNNFWEELMGV